MLRFCYILRADDDVVVNIELLLEKMKTFKSGITSIVWMRAKPNRVNGNKWYIPQSVYSNKTYPKYANGASYVY